MFSVEVFRHFHRYSPSYWMLSYDMIYHINISINMIITLISLLLVYIRSSLMAQMVKKPPTMHETWVWFLGQEDPLEKGVAAYSTIPAWRIQWTESHGCLQSVGLQRVRYSWATNIHTIYIKRMFLYISFLFLLYCWRPPVWC